MTMPIRWANAFGGPGHAPNPAGKGRDTPDLPNVELAGERHDPVAHALDVGKCQFGAFAMHRLRDAPRDGSIRREPDDQGTLAAQETHDFPLNLIVCSIRRTSRAVFPAGSGGVG